MDLDLGKMKKMKMKELTDLAKKYNLNGLNGIKKQDLIVKILEAQSSKDGNMYGEGVLEVLQDGFLKVFHNIGGYTFRGSFEGWMRRIMVNMSIDALRSSKQLQFVGESEEMLDVLSAKELEQSEPEWAALDHQDILEAMEQLTPMYRAVFNLYAIEGYAHREISEQLKISEGTSKSNYAKARRNLRELLREKLRKQ